MSAQESLHEGGLSVGAGKEDLRWKQRSECWAAGGQERPMSLQAASRTWKETRKWILPTELPEGMQLC